MLNEETGSGVVLSKEAIVEKLKDRNLSEVSRKTGVSIPTMWRIARNQAGNVGYETIKKISDYLIKDSA